MSRVAVEDFESEAGTNRLRRSSHTIAKGTAVIDGGVSGVNADRFYRLKYDGDIGAIHRDAAEVFSYGGFVTGLGGIDCSRCGTLSFRIRGNLGGERPNVYLDDGSFRWGVAIDKYAKVTTTWTDVHIPLDEFARYGVDLTHLSEVQFILEWEKMSGTVFLDDIRLGEREAPPVPDEARLRSTRLQ
jgi:hypothetical protein